MWKPPKYPGKKLPEWKREHRPVDRGLVFLKKEVLEMHRQYVAKVHQLPAIHKEAAITIRDAMQVCRLVRVNFADSLDYRTFKPFEYNYYGPRH
jgi:hypothetical protein